MKTDTGVSRLRATGRAFEHIARFHPELTAFRRDLHAHPELGFEEVYTSARVREALKLRLEKLDWMSDETKAKAIEKLDDRDAEHVLVARALRHRHLGQAQLGIGVGGADLHGVDEFDRASAAAVVVTT